jgi:hypothetical protein
MIRKLLLSLPLLTTACGLGIGPKSERHDVQPLDLTHVSAVRVNGTDGDITVQPATGSTGSVTFVEKTSRWFAGTGHCHYGQHVDNGTLVVDVKKDSNAGCEVETTVEAPLMAQVDIANSNGDVHVNDMAGTVNASNSNGDVKVSLASQGGDTPAANGTFSSSNGDVDVKTSFKPASGTLSLSTDNGDAKVGLPDGTPYSLSTKVDNGSVKKDFADTPSAPFHVSLKTDNGSLKIYKN